MRFGDSIGSVFRLALISLVGTALASCTGSDAQFGGAEGENAGGASQEGPASAAGESPEIGASVSLALINVPSDAACLEFAVIPTGSSWGARTSLFAIAPGATSATVTVSGLPSGTATIAARTFAIACAQVVASSSPTWVGADPVPLTLVAGQTASATLVLRKPSGVQVTTTFDDGVLALDANPTDFGGVQVGKNVVASVVVRNLGTSSATVPTPTITGTDASQFVFMRSGCGSSLPVGGNCFLLFVFYPTSAGWKTATATVGGASAVLTGTGLMDGLTFSPSPATFPPTAVGTSSTLTITLTNKYPVPVTTVWQLDGSPEFTFVPGGSCDSSLFSYGGCTQVVKFIPTSPGSKTATVSIGAGGSVTLNASATSGALTFSPNPKDFGGAEVNGYVLSTITVTNPGTSDVPFPTPTITGPDADLFLQGRSYCGSSVAAGQSCNLLFQFHPVSAGAKTATLNVGGASVVMTGTGLSGALTLTPSPANFPPTPVGGSSTLTLTLTNSSSVPVVTAWDLGVGAEFTFVSGGTCLDSIAASSSCTKVVKFAPTSAGSKSVNVIVPAGLSIALNGSTTLTAIYRINAGSGTAVSPFTGDQYYSGGTQASYSATINVTGVTNAAPAAVYQSERYGNSTYTFPNLTASTAHTVRLHMAELYQSAAGKRLFNVSINGTAVLTNFDTYVAAGNAKNKAVVREFTATSNASGQIVVQFTNVTDNASISGIEILK